VTSDFLARAPIALLPVLCFLATLLYYDSFKLVSLRLVLLAMTVGATAAIVSYPVNVFALDHLAMGFQAYSHHVAPWIEESLKALTLVVMIRSRRVGLLVDAAIAGFAIGTGFALVENLYYLTSRPDTHMAVQVIRGFGTAIMHGGATAVFAIVSVALFENRPDRLASVFLPGLVAAFALHSAYNHLLIRPLLATLGILVLLPPLIYTVFRRSERSLKQWLESDLDSDIELLTLIKSGEFSRSHFGMYLHALTERFRGEIVADMLCYLRLHVELAMRAKGVLLMRENDIEVEIDEETLAKLQELEYLERSIGQTGQLALRPLLMVTGKDLWQLSVLGK